MLFNKFSIDKSKRPTIPMLIKATLIDFDVVFLLIIAAAVYLHLQSPLFSIDLLIQEIQVWLKVIGGCFVSLFVAEICIWSVEYRRSKKKT